MAAELGEKMMRGPNLVGGADAINRLCNLLAYLVTPARTVHVFGIHLQLVVVGSSARDQAVRY